MNLNQVTVAVSNIEKSVAFYKALGLQLIVLSKEYDDSFARRAMPHFLFIFQEKR